VSGGDQVRLVLSILSFVFSWLVLGFLLFGGVKEVNRMELLIGFLTVINLWQFIFTVLPRLIESEGVEFFEWLRVGLSLAAMLVSCFWLGASLVGRYGCE
jgi:hypothetical protein